MVILIDNQELLENLVLHARLGIIARVLWESFEGISIYEMNFKNPMYKHNGITAVTVMSRKEQFCTQVTTILESIFGSKIY